MGSYFRGDVLLAPLCIAEGRQIKVRPLVVLGPSGRSGLFVIAVSSTLPYEGPVVPITIDDFSEGGLDLVAESYLVCSRICRIRVSDVIGKKGRLTSDMIQNLPIPEKGDTLP
ncbi:MAG TPA: type II toxin-antitoxin system PemK/MazF family toxin [Methanoregulaceae archaeon]|nr:type II toxin-antitoxin system PemK/MazF family toxin [Methanoregulaceae archaeon]